MAHVGDEFSLGTIGGVGSVDSGAINGASHSSPDFSMQSSFDWTLPGSLDLRQQTAISKDGRRIELKMSPVFQTAGSTSQAKLKLDFIPGAE